MTKGIRKSCLIDLERSIYCQIPNELYDLLNYRANISKVELRLNHSEEEMDIINRYLRFLLENKFLFEHSEKLFEYEKLGYKNETYQSAFHLEDVIIDISSIEHFSSILDKVPVYIETLQLRFFLKLRIKELEKIIQQVLKTGIPNLEMILIHDYTNAEKEYINLYRKNSILSKLVITGSSTTKFLFKESIIAVKQKLVNVKQCGIISEKNFFPNLRTYLSSKSCNSCLSKKVAIDTEGKIKQCPSMKEDFGNITSTKLEEAILKPDFKKYWNITKDDIEICKDCEFRYICTDCRAYTERTRIENGIDLSKPLKCGYNPYTNEWTSWFIDGTKQKAIQYYEMEELVELSKLPFQRRSD